MYGRGPQRLCRVVSPYEESEKELVWKLLSEAGLVDITLDDFPEPIEEAKHVFMGRLSELLELLRWTFVCQH